MEPRRPSDPGQRPIVMRTKLQTGVWRVTRDDVFFGDYFAAGPALEASFAAARDIERRGGSAQVLLDRPTP